MKITETDFNTDDEYRNSVFKGMRTYYEKQKLKKNIDPSHEKSQINFHTDLMLVYENGFNRTPLLSHDEKMKSIDNLSFQYFGLNPFFQTAYVLFKKEANKLNEFNQSVTGQFINNLKDNNQRRKLIYAIKQNMILDKSKYFDFQCEKAGSCTLFLKELGLNNWKEISKTFRHLGTIRSSDAWKNINGITSEYTKKIKPVYFPES